MNSELDKNAELDKTICTLILALILAVIVLLVACVKLIDKVRLQDQQIYQLEFLLIDQILNDQTLDFTE